MHLTERERERLLIAAGADLARRRLARGARLGAPEAIALISDEILEWAWDDVPYEEVVARARQVVPPEAVLPGVPALVPILQVEALFPYGAVLVHVPLPLGAPEVDGPGAVRPGAESRTLAPQRRRERAHVRNTGYADVWISSHLPLDTLNPALAIDAPPGRWRLDLPAGFSHRVPAGEAATLDIVEVVPAQQIGEASASPAGAS